MDEQPLKRGPGRPKLDPADHRTMRIYVAVSPAERLKLAANAQYRRMTVARYLRTAAIEACVIEAPQEPAA